MDPRQAQARRDRAGWLQGMIDGAASAFAFRRGSSPASGSAARVGKSRLRRLDRDSHPRGRAADVRRLAAEGFDRLEIARQTSLAQDTVSLLLNLPSAEAAETAGRGTFFRILETRIRD